MMDSEGMIRAAGVMRDAANEMSRAIGFLDWTLNQHRQFMDDWLQRFQSVVESQTKDKP